MLRLQGLSHSEKRGSEAHASKFTKIAKVIWPGGKSILQMNKRSNEIRVKDENMSLYPLHFPCY